MASFVVTETGIEAGLLAILEIIVVIKLKRVSLRHRKHIFEILLPNFKPMVVGTSYRPAHQTIFLKIFDENLSKVDTNNIKNVHSW